MPVPIVYRKSTDNNVASYDFNDIIDGTGTQKFYAIQQDDSTGITYKLAGNTIVPYQIEENYVPGTTTLSINLSSFNTPRTIKGTASISFGTALISTGAANFYCTCTLQKISASGTTTQVGTVQTQTVSNNNATTRTRMSCNISCTETPCGIGDNLRLSFAIVLTGGGSDRVWIGWDPGARAGTNLNTSAVPTNFDLYVPFRIDL